MMYIGIIEDDMVGVVESTNGHKDKDDVLFSRVGSLIGAGKNILLMCHFGRIGDDEYHHRKQLHQSCPDWGREVIMLDTLG